MANYFLQKWCYKIGFWQKINKMDSISDKQVIDMLNELGEAVAHACYENKEWWITNYHSIKNFLWNKHKIYVWSERISLGWDFENSEKTDKVYGYLIKQGEQEVIMSKPKFQNPMLAEIDGIKEAVKLVHKLLPKPVLWHRFNVP